MVKFPPLLPMLDCAERQIIPERKLLLRQAEFLPKRVHVDSRRRISNRVHARVSQVCKNRSGVICCREAHLYFVPVLQGFDDPFRF